MNVLNTREVKRLHKQLEEQYGYGERLRLVFLLQETKQKVYVFADSLREIDLSDIRIDSMGLYFGAWYDGLLRLTIEGTQLIGPGCTKNVVDLTREEMQGWMLGNDLERTAEGGPFVIVRHGPDYLGCGKIAGGKILNYIPKTRYVHATYT